MDKIQIKYSYLRKMSDTAISSEILEISLIEVLTVVSYETQMEACSSVRTRNFLSNTLDD